MSLEEKGKEHCHAHCCHQVGGTASWELVSWEQASQALLLKSYLVEEELFAGWYPDTEKRPYEVPAHTEQEKLDTLKKLFLGEGAMPFSLVRSSSA